MAISKKRIKIVTVVGARPQFIKAAVVSPAIRRHPGISEVMLHTGQHFDRNMSEIFFSELEIPRPNYHLDINKLQHGAMTGRMLEAIEKILQKERPDWVIVYGDTNSTLAGALAAKKLHIRVAHVEAGMRHYNLNRPEEINRVLTDRISDLLFCSTKAAADNLRREGFKYMPSSIMITGDVMYDAALYYSKKAEAQSSLHEKVPLENFLLCTLHREENTNDEKALRRIFSVLNQLHREIPVVLPLHPRTRKFLNTHHIRTSVHLINPVGYLDMIMLIRNCRLVITDSGGLQKEAYFFKKFCVTLREETEWTELVKEGVNDIVGTNPKKIMAAVHEFLEKKPDFRKKFYGDGNAAEKIVNALINFK